MNEFFRLITGNEIYPYQEMVASSLLSNSNVFLRAPTGSGKTLAAVLPFLWARKEKIKFADRLIYILPLRALATYLHQETTEQCVKLFNVKQLSSERTYEENELVITLQTGEDKNDPFFEGDIIFTTIDQCLSSYINNPVSLPKKLANINAGALVGSLLVLDEFHLLDPDKSFCTSIEMLKRLKPFSQFVIMTATFASETIQMLSRLLDCVIVQPSPEEILSFPSHQGKKRVLRLVKEPMTADHVIAQHNMGRSIVITNTVTRAQIIFKALYDKLRDTNTKLLLLHSRFYNNDRKNTEDQLADWFGKNAIFTNVILVTTQVVEAGMNISADNLHTEIAPANSLVQRMGRCARYAGDRGNGVVWIYELMKDAGGKQNSAPYKDASLNETWLALLETNLSEKSFDFEQETSLINHVHTKEELSYISLYQANEFSLQTRIHEAMDGGKEAACRELIRDVSSVSVIICDNRYSLRFAGDRWPAMISVPRSTLFGLTKCFEQASSSGENVAWYPLDESNIDADDEQDGLHFGWQPISSRDELLAVSWLIVIHPSCAKYRSDIGLQIGTPGTSQEIQYSDRPTRLSYPTHFETFSEHTRNVLKQCALINEHSGAAIDLLSKYYRHDTNYIKQLTEIVCSLHDLGKLSMKWQEKARAWQSIKDPAKITDEPIAHTDFNPETDYEIKKKHKIKFPPHSAEGSYAILQWLYGLLENYDAFAVISAIARHHGAFTESLQSLPLIHDAMHWITESVSFYGSDSLYLEQTPPDNITQRSFGKDCLLSFRKDSDVNLWPLYVYIVRLLRLSDQKSMQGGLTR